MSRGDVRAVENPISAVFDLAEEVNAEIPKFRKLVTYATIFIGIWLFIDFILMLATLGSQTVVGLLLLILFVVGVLALAMLRNLGDFMRYYAQRHTAIVRVRDEDPVIYVPKGDSAVLRLLELLRTRSPSMAQAIANHDYQVAAILKGSSGLLYNFDAYLRSKPGTFWKLLGIGYPGYQLFVKVFGYPPRPEDLAALKAATEDVCKDTRMPPSRVIALWTRKAEQDLSEQAYKLLSESQVAMSHRGKRYVSSLELIIENDDSTYEFIPYIAA